MLLRIPQMEYFLEISFRSAAGKKLKEGGHGVSL